MKIGFIGLGKMGAPMAHNLLKAGMDLTVFDVMPEAVQALVADGAKAASSIQDLSTGMDVVITMVQTGQQVSDLCLGESGIFKAFRCCSFNRSILILSIFRFLLS